MRGAICYSARTPDGSMNGMPKFEIDFLPDHSEQTLIEELQRIARALGKNTICKRDIAQHGRVSYDTVLRRFGTIRRALQAAGLRPMRFMKASADELLDVLERTWVVPLERFGRRPRKADLSDLGMQVSDDTITRRFGSWKKALVAVAERANQGDSSVADEVHEPAEPAQPSKDPGRASLSIRKRFLIMKRDQYRCRLCGAAGVAIEVDHIVPVARGGSDALDNLQTLCFQCNRGKRDSLE